jgi:hypothetical protein
VPAKPANEVTIDPGRPIRQEQGLYPLSPPSSASACDPYRETIELGVNFPAHWAGKFTVLGVNTDFGANESKRSVV